MRSFLDFDDQSTARGRSPLRSNNYDWMSRFSYLEFLRDIGKNFPVNVMLAKDSVKSRLERDRQRAELHRVQLHAVAGLRFRPSATSSSAASCKSAAATSGATSRPASTWAGGCARVQLYGITCPLLTKSDGSKMGKTETGAIWLSPGPDQPLPVLSILDQRRRCRRRQVPAVLHRAAARRDRIARCRPRRQARSRESQRRLAEEITRLVHGDSGLAAARRATEIFFGAEIDHLSDAQLGEIFADVPSRTQLRAPPDRRRPEHRRCVV